MTSATNYSSGRIDFWAFVQSKTVVLTRPEISSLMVREEWWSNAKNLSMAKKDKEALRRLTSTIIAGWIVRGLNI